MEEWLRCNTCFHRMKNSSRVFYLTACDHVFCSYCVDGASNQCPECGTVGVGIIPIRETSSQQKMYGVESVSSHAKILIETPRFCRVQYLILSRYAWKTDEAYHQLVKSTEQLIEATELSQVLQKRLKENLAKHRRPPINVAPSTTYERNVTVTTKPTLEIFTNNARPQLAEPKSEYFPKDVQPQLRNWREPPHTSIYDYPQPVERESEYFSKNPQSQFPDWKELPQTSDYHYPQLDELKSEYSSKKSQSRRRSSIQPAKQSKLKSCLRKKKHVHENILPEASICDYSQQKRSRKKCSTAGAQIWTRDPQSLIDTPNLNYAQWKNRATKFASTNPQPPEAEFRDLHLHNNRLVRSTNHCDQPHQCKIAYAPENTEYLARAIIDAPEVSEPMNEKTSYGEPQWRTGKSTIGIHGMTVVHETVKALGPRRPTGARK